MSSIDNIRHQIDTCDQELLSVMAKRFQLVQRLAKLKKENHLPIRQKNREKEIIKQRILWAKKLDIPQACIRAIFQEIFRLSRNRQKTYKPLRTRN